MVVKASCTAENATEPQVSGPVWYESHSKGLTTIHVQLGEDVEKERTGLKHGEYMCYLLPDNYRHNKLQFP